MIARVWRGWTRPDQADPYERLLKESILPEIAEQASDGYHGAEVFRRDLGDEVEFMTLLRFDAMEDVRQFVGDEPGQAHVPEKARRHLHRYEDRVQHYEYRGRSSAGA